jgi:hypothetical protein
MSVAEPSPDEPLEVKENGLERFAEDVIARMS